MPLPIPVRLGVGTLSQVTILNSDSYLVSNFAVQADMNTLSIGWSGIEWKAITEGTIDDGTVEIALDRAGKYYGGAKGAIKFFLLTPNMLDYLWVNIFEEKPRNNVTLYVMHQQKGATVYNCSLQWAFAGDVSAEVRSEQFFSNVIFKFDNGTIAEYGRAYSNAYSSAFG
jgi:hypothetical protein